MTTLSHLPLAVALWMVAWVGLYWAYTLLGMAWLEPLLGRTRHLANSAGLVALTLGILAVRQAGGVEELLAWNTTLPTALALGAYLYARRNQWLAPRPATRLVASAPEASSDPMVAVLADGSAVPLGVLRRARTAVTSDLLVVHCGLSRSLAVFQRPGETRPAAILPHPTGFTIGADGHRWNGVDGRATGDGSDLVGCWVGLCSHDAWRSRHPEGRLLLPEGLSGPAATTGERTPVVPGARSTQDPSCWGRIQAGQWMPVSDDELQRCPEPVQGVQPRYIARWAAIEQGLQVAAGEADEPSGHSPPGAPSEPDQDQQGQ